ncbi:unnamed protein product [Aphanomyces euteiches]
MAMCREADAVAQINGGAMVAPLIAQAIDAGLAPVLAQLRAVLGVMQNLDTSVQGVQANVQGVHAQTQGLRVDVQGVHAQMQGLRADVQGVRADVQGVHAQMQGLQAGVQELRADVQGVHAQMQGLQAGVQDLQVSVGALQNGQNALQNGQNALRSDVRILLVNAKIFSRNKEAATSTALAFQPPAKFNAGFMARLPLGAMGDIQDIPDDIAPAFANGPPAPGPDVFPPPTLPFLENNSDNLTIREIGYLCRWYNDGFAITPNDRHEDVLAKFKDFLIGK